MMLHTKRQVAVGLLTLVIGSPMASPSTAQTDRPLIASGESPGLFVLYSGDVTGYVDPCG